MYIDLNMVRAGVVRHPSEWKVSGYREIQAPPDRYRVIDHRALLECLEIGSLAELKERHAEWVEEALAADRVARDERWTAAVAVGSRAYVDEVGRGLGVRARGRQVEQAGDTAWVREETGSYWVERQFEA